MFFTSKLIAILPLLTGTLANPILSARSCKPNFQGNPITIYQTIPGSSDVNEWTPVNANGGHITLVQEWEWHAFESGEFLIPFTGQPDSSYNFKLVADTARALQLAGASGGDLSFAPIIFSGTTQTFGIECSSCSLNSVDVGLACVISHPATNTCVTGNTGGATLALAPCKGSSAQVYNFRRA